MVYDPLAEPPDFDERMNQHIQPFCVDVPNAVLEDLGERLARTRLPDQIEGSGWGYGTDRTVLREFLDYWRDGYDWRAEEARINAFDQYVTMAQGERLHFIHARSPELDAIPLVITHGWPGSVVEFLQIVAPLSNPRAHGGDPADAFHVVCPSIPGYAFSGPTRQPGFHVHRVADAVAELMERLGYDRYVAQGGDWGALVTRRLGEVYAKRLIGVHFNMLFCLPTDMSDPTVWEAVTPEERMALQRAAARVADGTAYMAIQGTKPQTLAYGLNDSPAGLAGWILEKFHAWSDCDGNLESVYTKDQLLTNIMLYWVTGTANSAARLYCESQRAGCFATNAWQGRVEVPTGFARYPGELVQPARVWADQRYEIVHWTEQPRGGHFAAFEQPELFVSDLRAFGRIVR
jgi:microsomal epoxide hydrolase